MKQQIEITNSLPDINEGKSNRTGNDFKIVTQEAYIHTQGERYPLKVAFPLEHENKSYKEGFYEVDESNLFTSGSFDSFDIIRTPLLVPAKQPQPKPQQNG